MSISLRKKLSLCEHALTSVIRIARKRQRYQFIISNVSAILTASKQHCREHCADGMIVALEKNKAFIETRGKETGAWRGTIR